MNCLFNKSKPDYVNINSENITKIVNNLKRIYKINNEAKDVDKLNTYLKKQNILDHDEILDDIAHRHHELKYYTLAIRLYYKLMVIKIKNPNQNYNKIRQIMNKLMILNHQD